MSIRHRVTTKATRVGVATIDGLLRPAGRVSVTDPEREWEGWLESIANASRRRLLALNRIDLVVDVGANTGQYGLAIRSNGYRGPILSIEPLRSCHAALARECQADGNWRFEACAVGHEEKTCEIHVAANSVSSSLLPMLATHVDAAPHSAIVRTDTVEVRRLDDLLVAEPAAQNIWLKIDTQGYEWPVIDGARTTLERTVVVEMELSLRPLYEGQRLMAELIESMEELGFALAAIHEVFTHPRTGQLLQVDGMFVRTQPDPTT